MKRQLLLCSIVAFCVLTNTLWAASKPSAPRQMLVVITPDWTDIHGKAQRYERASDKGKWHAVGPKFDVVVGKTGLAWGIGLKNVADREGPVKHEGDGKAPAGIFRLTEAFGYAADALAPKGLQYVPLDANSECVDDVGSKHYNEVLDDRTVNKDWNSSEMMRRNDELYRWGVVVAHNSDRKAGAGSCIFLHIWRGPDQPTVGCTAMPQPDIENLLRWFSPEENPILVQLPKAEYESLRTAWKLP